MSQEARQKLTEYWGYTHFRPMQEEIIDSVLQGKDTLALLATGGGKSLTFQIPGLIKPGCCLVITPLISLMKDQVDRLKKLGIFAKALYTGMFHDEIEAVLSEAIHGKLKFLYVSPERLMSNSFQYALAKINVNLIAVDEAHCISQWGYNFRPPYLKIAEIRKYFTDTPVLALTATATPKVVNDIMEKLNFRSPNELRSSFERKNLVFRVFNENDKTARLIQFLASEKGSAIVYVRNRRKTRALSEILIKNNISASFYHAGLDQKTRLDRQNYWTLGKIRVLVATNAFGMGIDKSDVRQVIHYDLPDCLESYFQEAGRAGRDEKPSTATLFFNNQDVGHAKKQLVESFPEIDTIRNIYNALGNYFQIPEGTGQDLGFDFKITDFANQYGFGLITLYSAIKLMEKEGYLAFDESSGRYSKLIIKLSNEDLYRFMVEHERFEILLKEIMRSYGGIFSDYVAIDEKLIAKRSEMSLEDVYKALKYLSQIKIVGYIPLKTSPQIFFNTVRLPKENIGFSQENYQNLKKAAARRLDALIDYLNDDKECRSVQLLRYFGETGGKRCGTCDVCNSINKMDVTEFEFDSLSQQIKSLLTEKPRHLYELVPLISEHEEKKVLSVIQWLTDNRQVIRQKDEKLNWYEQMDLGI
ncbi:MAG: RecQ family ATP-dependent DNA helicase [Bacteroidales bacterium]|nr:RecQ family ATP-dependent DNA helicase [Bacteroidales bacterium]